MPVGVEPLPPLEYVVGLGRPVDGLVPRLLEEVVDGRLTVGRETDVDGRLVDGLVPRPVGRETDVDGRLTVIFPAGLLTDMLPFD